MKIAVAVTGASGSIYAKVLLDALARMQAAGPVAEVSLVMSTNAKAVWTHELGGEGWKDYDVRNWEKTDFNAPFASGSSTYGALVVCPCSMGTLGRIAAGTSDDLVTRAADVMLKERRCLILVVRETPYNLVQLRNMAAVTEAGGIVCPATPSFYSRPQDFEALAATVTDRVLGLCGLDAGGYKWGEES